MSVTFSDDGTTGTIHRWPYSDENTFQVGQIPEPSSFLLALIGAIVLFRRSRR